MGISPSREDRKSKSGDPKHERKAASVMTISNEVVQRIKTGVVDENRMQYYDQTWLDKMASVDNTHTETNKLNPEEAERLIKNIDNFAEGKIGVPCGMTRERTAFCLAENEEEPLNCAEEVGKFVQCVDQLLYDTNHRPNDSATSAKKSSLAEQFQKQL